MMAQASKRAKAEEGGSSGEVKCCGCGEEARLPGQRYGKRCRSEAQKKSRKKLRDERLLLRKFLEQ